MTGIKNKRTYMRICIFSLIFFIAAILSFSISCKKDDGGQTDVLEDTISPDDTLTVVYFSEDPPAISPVHAFDPDSYSVLNCIFDTLVYLDYDGNIKPRLATRWKLQNPTTMRMWLRKGVKFHNGDPFDAKSVKYTFDKQLDPRTKSPTGAVLNSVKEVKIIDDFTIDIVTHFPDGMLLYRFTMFSSIIPDGFIEKNGKNKLNEHPIGTGPYKFVSWNKGKSIRMEKNSEYWLAGEPKMDKLVFKIIPEKDWFKALLKGNVDFVMQMSGRYASKIEKDAETKLMKRLVTSSYWIILSNKGAFANINVRKALNLAIDRQKLIKFGEYGNGEVMASLGKKGEFGYNSSLKPIKQDIAKAKELLKDAGFEKGLKIKALVSDVSAKVADLLKKDFAKIGVTLEIVEVSRPEWAKKIPISKMTKGKVDFDGDMIINLVDNPLINLGFHAFIFLHSKGPFSLQNNPDYDKELIGAVGTSNPAEHKKKLKELDEYIYDNVLVIPTYQRVLTVALRKNVKLEKINLNGHLSFDMITRTVKKK
ncbi:MAG: ABC transporter substrate-binding protein [bacterium]|nr:ABC transporter substrate-binding protein [bacterium]